MFSKNQVLEKSVFSINDIKSFENTSLSFFSKTWQCKMKWSRPQPHNQIPTLHYLIYTSSVQENEKKRKEKEGYSNNNPRPNHKINPNLDASHLSPTHFNKNLYVYANKSQILFSFFTNLLKIFFVEQDPSSIYVEKNPPLISKQTKIEHKQLVFNSISLFNL